MRTYKLILFIAVVLFLVVLSVLANGQSLSAAGPTCNSTKCYVIDTTVDDFGQGTRQLTGLRNIGDGEVQLLPVGLTAPWITDTHQFLNGTDGRRDTAGIIYNDVFYLVGGYDNSSVVHDEIFTVTTLITGPLKSNWNVASHLPVALEGMAVAVSPTVASAFLYAIGGQTDILAGSSGFSSKIYYARIYPNGTVGTWYTATLGIPDQTDPTTFVGAVYVQAAVYNGNLYLFGGRDATPTTRDSVFHASIDPSTGNLTGAWIQDTNMSTQRQLFGGIIGLTSGGPYLYAVGGSIDGSTGMGAVDYGAITLTGGISSFLNTQSALPDLLYYHSVAQFAGGLYATGGAENGGGNQLRNGLYSAVMNSDGSLQSYNYGGTFYNWIPSSPMPQGRKGHATAVNSGGIIYVVGGSSPDSFGTDLTYYGSTQGTGAYYAPQGTFTSRIISLGGQQNISQIIANTTITDTVNATMTIQYRASAISAEDLVFTKTFQTLPPIGAGIQYSNTYTLGGLTASFVQYRVLYTLTNSMYNYSPALNAFEIDYPLPPAPPQFVITSMTAPISSTIDQPAAIITYTVKNQSAANAPSRTTKAPSRSRAPAIDAAYGFNVTFYYNRPTSSTVNGPNDLNSPLNCYDTSPQHSAANGSNHYPPYIFYTPGGFTDLTKTDATFLANCFVPAYATNFWVQIDTCQTGTPNCYAYGYFQEIGEPASYADNIMGPIAAGSSSNHNTDGGGGLYLPYIKR